MIFTEFKNTLTRHEVDTAQTITKGNLVSLDYTSNKLKAGISNGSNILGIAQESGIAGDFIYVATSGTAEGATNLIVGETCWSDSNGVLFPDSTAVANSAGYFVGICVSTSEVRIDMKTFTPIPVIDPGLLQNYIANPIAKETSDVTAWNVYDDSSAIPVDGIGGTTSITLSQNLINPISSTGDFKLTKGAFDLQGEGISYDFTIQPIHLAKIQQIEFNAKLFSGTYEKGDIRVYIIQDPNGTPKIIEPINVELELASIGNTIRYLGSFQTDYSQLNYRLVIHIASISTLAYTIHFNNFKVWEPTKNYGAIITNWESYVPTIQGGGTLSGVNVKYRRVGSNLEIQGSLNLGTTSNSEFRMSLPNSLVISSDIIANQVIGKLNSSSISNSFYKSFNLLGISGVSYLTLAVDSERDDILNAILPINSDSIESSSLISFHASVPIQGWGSNMALSSDVGDGSVVAFSARGLNFTVAANVKHYYQFVLNDIFFDTLGSWDLNTNTYKTPSSGIYTIEIGLLAGSNSSSAKNQIYYSLNGATEILIGNSKGDSGFKSFTNTTFSLELKSGDLLQFLGETDYVSFDIFSLAISKLSSGSQVIARDESVNAKMYVNNGFGISTSEVQIPFNIVEFDTHGICDINTGNITIPISGKYQVVCNISHDALSSTNQSTTYIKKNGGVITQITEGYTGWNQHYNASAIIEAKSNDIITVSIVASQSMSSSLCDVSIYRIGN